MDHLGYALSKILVTGAQGYLGAHILSMLRKKDINALGIGRTRQSDIVCDLLDHTATEALISRYPESTIIHCAAAVPKSHSDYFDELAASENLAMVSNLANACPRRLIFISSMTVYPDNTVLAHEEDAASPGKGYAASKIQSERLLLKHPSITVTILRLPGLFGLPRRGGLLYNSALALARGDMPVLDPILPQWAAIHVEDAADICIRAAMSSPSSSMVMNAGYPERMAIPDAITRLGNVFSRTLNLHQPLKWFALDLSRLHAVLGPVSGTFSNRLKDLADLAIKDTKNENNA
jgi:nucleoside-diphosphate-sugar epimerase